MFIHTISSNRPRSFYRGSGAISRFRNEVDELDSNHPEDWVASVTTQFGRSAAGLSNLGDGRMLREAIEQNPIGWLGADHVERFGVDARLLVKLLDAGQRLPLHSHPNADFAARHLGANCGKTEAWIVLEAPEGAFVHLGFARDVEAREVIGWAQSQDVAAMLAATNVLPVAAGDSLFVPAGVPHAIGEGILLAELQEPSDFSIFLEWEGFDFDGARLGHLGLGLTTALGSLDLGALGADRLADLRSMRGSRYFPPEADGFFRADRIEVHADESVELEAGYGVLIVLGGRGELSAEKAASVALAAGQTLLVPHDAGGLHLSGDGLVLLRARPPAPTSAFNHDVAVGRETWHRATTVAIRQ